VSPALTAPKLNSHSAEQIPEALERIEERAQSDPAHRKLFIRGLTWETTDEQLHSSFASYGEIEEAAVVMDRTSGKNKGYGFVIFKDMDSAYAALQEPDKEIDVFLLLPNPLPCLSALAAPLIGGVGKNDSLQPGVIGRSSSAQKPLGILWDVTASGSSWNRRRCSWPLG
jgi:RNA recognition motif-containing protein